MRFKASLDSLAKGITIGTSILFIVIIILQVVIFISNKSFPLLVIPILLIVIYLITYFYRPVNYNITDTDLVIHRPLTDVIIPKKDIRNVIRLTKDQLKRTIRTFGNGGLFGYYGKFANSKLGSMTWYATRKDTTILIETFDNKKLVVTPDEPEEFIKQFGTGTML